MNAETYYALKQAQKVALLEENVPKPLRDKECWVLWKEEPKARGDGYDKIPYYASGRKRGPNGTPEDRASLVTFEEALQALKANPKRYTGVGIALLKDMGVVAVDFDKLSESPNAKALADSINGSTYTETSPSGNGLRALFVGSASSRKRSGVEIFGSSCFVTITGWHAKGEKLAAWEQAPSALREQDTPKERATPAEHELVSIRKLAEVLEAIPNKELDYDSWLRVVAAAHESCGGSDEGYALAKKWSESSAKHEQGKFDSAWESFARRAPDASRVGFGTLMHMAGQVAEKAEDTDGPGIERVEIANLLAVPPAPPRFLIENWLPADTLTLYAGHGGVGKSYIALLIAVCVALGLPILGGKPKRTITAFFSGEDASDILRWRLYRIYKMLGLKSQDVGELAKWLHVYDATGNAPILFATTTLGARPTGRYDELRELCTNDEVGLLVVDNASDTFCGNENARAEVRAFVNKLVALVRARHGAVLLLAHVNKMAARSGEGEAGWSGSTAWHNSARSRWYLHPKRGGDGAYLLSLEKSNHGRSDLHAPVTWNDSAMAWQLGDVHESGICDPTEHVTTIVRIVKRLQEAGERLSAKKGAKNSVYALAHNRTDWPRAVDSKTAAVIVDLAIQQGYLKVEQGKGADRHHVYALVVTAAGLRACSE